MSESSEGSRGLEMQRCPKCGRDNVATANFCSHCGTPLTGGAATDQTITFPGAASAGRPDAEERPALNDSDAAAVDALPRGSALLIVQRGPGAGSRYLLDTDVVSAGRHPASDIFLDDITVSRRHVEFRQVGDGYAVHDIGSLNGTYVNRDRIDEVLLQNGDEVRVGKFRLVYFAHAPEA